jgi:hypothetical protein
VKNRPKIFAASVIVKKAAQTKQSPNRPKFGQSGRPGRNGTILLPIFYAMLLFVYTARFVFDGEISFLPPCS